MIFLSNAPTDAVVVSNDRSSNYALFENNQTSEIEFIQKKKQFMKNYGEKNKIY